MILLTDLNSLPVLLEDIDPHHCMVKLWVGRLDNLIMFMFFELHTIKSFEHKLKECA